MSRSSIPHLGNDIQIERCAPHTPFSCGGPLIPASWTTTWRSAKASLCRAGYSRAHVFGVWPREFPQAGKADLCALVIEEDPNCGQT
jgi:hypothetical protein